MVDMNLDFLQWVISFFDKKTSSGTVKNEIISNNQLSEELHKPVTKYTHLS